MGKQLVLGSVLGAIVIGWLLASFVMATVVRGKVMT